MTAAGIGLALAFVVTAGAAHVAGASVWLALHLLLVGGAGVAIGAAMPFFSAALGAAPPAPTVIRTAVVVGLAAGAAAVAAAVPRGLAGLAAAGGLVYLVSIAGLAAVTLLPLRRSLAPRRWPIVAAYSAALAFVATGVSLVVALLASWAPVVGAWALLKPAHAWLNLFGFVGLTILGTAIHLYPTLVGARITRGRLPTILVGAFIAGVALVAGGFALGSDVVVRVGALAALVAAAAVPPWLRSVLAQPGRGRWAADRDWHTFTSLSLGAALAWLALGTAVAAALVLVSGATAAAWDLRLVVVPLAVGGVLQALLASIAHLLPTAGPGAPERRARIRRSLGRLATARVVAFQGGAGALAVGHPLGIEPLAAAGGLLLALSVGITALLLAAGGVSGSTRPRSSGAEGRLAA